jgi:hypothetical protein
MYYIGLDVYKKTISYCVKGRKWQDSRRRCDWRMLRAIAAAKKKNDRIGASKVCDCLRCDFLRECYTAPTALRERRSRNLLVRQLVRRRTMEQTPEKSCWLTEQKST